MQRVAPELVIVSAGYDAHRLDPLGGMLVHPDPALEGRNKLGLKDISGRPIIQGLLENNKSAQKSSTWNWAANATNPVAPSTGATLARCAAAPSVRW